MKRIIVKGAPGSPYTRKMLSLLRYRRIPYNFIISGLLGKGIMDTKQLPKAKIDLMPTFYFENEEKKLDPMVDSTFILRRLENSYSTRSVIPENSVLKFLDYLLEDFADEWLTKATFHYRWTYDEDIKKAGATLSRWGSLTDKNILKLMDNHMNNFPYIFGERPSSSDFALYGQLTQLAAFDPTPMKIADNIASRIVAWVGIMEDLSGLEVSNKDWINSEILSVSLKNIFCELGRVYVPVLLANFEALNNNKEEVKIEIDGRLWTQKRFLYQGKCLNWIKEQYSILNHSDKEYINSFLDKTGCEKLFYDK